MPNHGMAITDHTTILDTVRTRIVNYILATPGLPVRQSTIVSNLRPVRTALSALTSCKAAALIGQAHTQLEFLPDNVEDARNRLSMTLQIDTDLEIYVGLRTFCLIRGLQIETLRIWGHLQIKFQGSII